MQMIFFLYYEFQNADKITFCSLCAITHKTIRQTHANQMLNILLPVIGSHEQEVKSNSARCSQDGFCLVVVSGSIERYKDSSH